MSLFSLSHFYLLPIDTHVLQILSSLTPSRVQQKSSLSLADHERIRGFWREKFGAYGGWAHCFLFAAALPAFRESESVKETGRERKKEKKKERRDKEGEEKTSGKCVERKGERESGECVEKKRKAMNWVREEREEGEGSGRKRRKKGE